MADDRQGLFARPDAPHRVHDLLLIAAFAAGDATNEDRPRAEALIAACTECATLATDLRAIQRASATVPAAARRRDFRLTPADAERLRPHGVRRFVAAVGHPSLARAQPLAAGLTMLGLAGLLVSTISFGPGGSAASPSADTTNAAGSPRQLEQSVPLTEGSGGPAFGTQAEPSPWDANVSPAIRDTDAPGTAAPNTIPSVTPTGPLTNPVAIGSGLLLAFGVLLFVVAAGRSRSD